jgi:hypothetical protein
MKKNISKDNSKTYTTQETPLSPAFQVLRVMHRSLFFSALALFLFSLFLVDISIFATTTPSSVNLSGALTEAGTNAALGTRTIGEIVANIIQVVLGLLGVVFVILIIYSGFLWMSASGNDERIKSAQGHLRNAVIGVSIVIGAQIITYFVLYNVTQAALPK